MAESQEFSRITTLAQLDDLVEASSERAMWLFKHSLICPTSDGAWSTFERFAAKHLDATAVGVVEIQRARDVSREVKVRTGVRHESPQVLLIRDGQAVWHASHWAISLEALEAAVESCAARETAGTASLVDAQ